MFGLNLALSLARSGFVSALRAVQALFSLGQQGVVMTPSLDTLFQDNTGITATTALDQAVGLVLDIKGSTVPSVLFAAARPDMGPAGTTVPTVNNGDTFLSIPATSVTFPVLAAGGFAVSRCQGAGFTSQVPITASAVTRSRFRVGLSRALAVGESIQVYSTGTAASSAFVLGSTHVANQWYDTGLMGLPVKLGGVYYPVVYAQTALATPVTVYVSEYYVEAIPGNHLTQGTVASRPLVKAGGSLLFDGIDDFLLSTTGGGSTTGFFLCAAVSLTGGAGVTRMLWSDDNVNTGFFLYASSLNVFGVKGGNGVADVYVPTHPTPIVLGTTYLVTVWYDGATLWLDVNGATTSVAIATIGAGTAGFTQGKTNGAAATNFFPGNILSSVYVKDSGLTAAQRSQAQAYVRNQSGL
jgi:hypothetical protein